MKKEEATKIAREFMREAIGTAYYKLENFDYSADENDAISNELDKFGKKLSKVLGYDKFITY